MVSNVKFTDMNEDELSCVCPDGKCHLGRDKKKSEEKNLLCDRCINLWFRTHLRHRIEKMLKHEETESKCIVMRSLLQFLGLGSKPYPTTGTLDLQANCDYFNHNNLAKIQNSNKWSKTSKITYEIRADNLGGESFNEASLKLYKQDNPKDAKLLARFIYGVHQHTAHLTWGANHSDGGTIWNINDPKANKEVVRVICILLEKRVYKKVGRKPPWDKEYRYTSEHDEDELPTTESNATSG